MRTSCFHTVRITQNPTKGVRLGVLADEYKINFYGEATSSSLHQIGTDRLWVSWMLDSPRVHERLHVGAGRNDPPSGLERIAPLVQVGANNEPQRESSAGVLSEEHLVLEIPLDINALQRENPELGIRWREATRQAFTQAITAGYVVEDFYRAPPSDRPVGIYLLCPGKRLEDFELAL